MSDGTISLKSVETIAMRALEAVAPSTNGSGAKSAIPGVAGRTEELRFQPGKEIFVASVPDAYRNIVAAAADGRSRITSDVLDARLAKAVGTAHQEDRSLFGWHGVGPHHSFHSPLRRFGIGGDYALQRVEAGRAAALNSVTNSLIEAARTLIS